MKNNNFAKIYNDNEQAEQRQIEQKETERQIQTNIERDAQNVENRRSYTQIQNAVCDRRTVRILRRLIAGRNGIMTAINTYLFQSFVAGDANLQRNLGNVATGEMNHMELLSRAIVAFCGVPRLSAVDGSFWSGRFVNYQTNSQRFLECNICDARERIRAYNRAIELVGNQSLRQLLGEIVDDEQSNIALFENLR